VPLTVQFGPWAPDQSENPIQFPDQLGPIPVPCADCLNVIYTNGNYRSIASPQVAAIDGNPIQPLSAVPVSAFSYFDTVEQQETVFAGTAAGVQQLNADGSWSQISLITTQTVALVGVAMGIKVGNFANALTPAGQRMTMRVGVLTPMIEGITFVAGTYAQAGGPHGGGFSFIGYGAASRVFGSLVTSILSFGTLVNLYDSQGADSVLGVDSPTDPGQSAFTSITANGKTYTSASATYTYSLGVAKWVFPSLFGFATGTTYAVVIA